MSERIPDKDLLDFVDGIAERYNPAEGDGWIMRDSLTGRGARLHMTTRSEMDRLGIEVPIHRTAREAIAYFMRSISLGRQVRVLPEVGGEVP